MTAIVALAIYLGMCRLGDPRAQRLHRPALSRIGPRRSNRYSGKSAPRWHSVPQALCGFLVIDSSLDGHPGEVPLPPYVRGDG